MVTEQEYRQWISDCARSTKPGESRAALLEHVQKHAGPDLLKRVLRKDGFNPEDDFYSEDDSDWAGWVASMYNLLAIVELKLLGRMVTTEEKWGRMMKAWRRDKEFYQGPPIPNE